MESFFPFLFVAAIGFGHAFEADHLVAVGNIVTKREKLGLAIKDGIYWGLGHTSTIFIIGLMIIVGKVAFMDGLFGYFEALVGLMLILLGLFRLYQLADKRTQQDQLTDVNDSHHLAYGVGAVHGLAGSGAMILLVMTEIQSSVNSMIYLSIFGIGSIAGMLVAGGIFSLPFSKKITKNPNLQLSLIIVSSLLCIAYGAYVMIDNLS